MGSGHDNDALRFGRRLLQALEIGVWEWNPQTGSLVVDEHYCKVLGLEPGSLPPTDEVWRSRVHPDDLAEVLELHERHLRGETRFYQSVHRARHASGRWIPLFARGCVVDRDPSGACTRFLGTMTDISFIKEIEEQLLRARIGEEKRRHLDDVASLAGDLVHDLGNPLTIVLGRLQEIERHVDDPVAIRARVGSALEAVGRMNRSLLRLRAYIDRLRQDD